MKLRLFLLSAVLCLFVQISAAQRFLPAATFPTNGYGDRSIALGDFNGDGKLDVATANANTQDVSILLGNGDGTLQAPLKFPVNGSVPWNIIAADFNHDGHLDLATANLFSNNVSVLFGNGDGTFQQPVILTGGFGFPFSLAAADFNGDGNTDLAVCGGTVAVFFSNGDGTFQNPIISQGGNGPAFVAAADLNGDHLLDIAIADNSDSTMGIGTGDGSGFFPVTASFSVPSPPDAVVVADFNGDGFPDIALADEAVNGTNSHISVFIGDGKGGFRRADNYPVDPEPTSIQAADLNGDGKIDLVTANEFNNGSISIFHGKGSNGTFEQAFTFSDGLSQPTSAMIGDFNGDGLPDLAIAHPNFDVVAILLQKSHGSADLSSASAGTGNGSH